MRNRQLRRRTACNGIMQKSRGGMQTSRGGMRTTWGGMQTVAGRTTHLQPAALGALQQKRVAVLLLCDLQPTRPSAYPTQHLMIFGSYNKP